MTKKKRKESITISKKGASAKGPNASLALMAMMGIENVRCKCGTLNLGDQGKGPPTVCTSCKEPLS